jgi:ABC-type uncharacterized transport system substrate-binding protein
LNRREFITLLGGAAAAWPLSAHGQQPERVRRIGVLMAIAESDREGQDRVAAFREAFEKLGWADGRNVRIDVRYDLVDPERMRSHVTALLGQTPDVIVAVSTPVLEAVLKQTRSVPIVFIAVSDPVSAGFVSSLARPGGNITGFSNFEYTIGGKWFEILMEAVPATKRVAVLMNRDDPAWARYLAPIESLGPSRGVRLTRLFLGDPAETERAIDAFADEPDGGLIITNNFRAVTQRDVIVGVAVRRRLPAIYPARIFVNSGGLMSYGIDPVDLFRRATSYVDRILRGEKPGDMPVQLPTKFEFVVNLRAARALGLALPLPLIGRTDEVIE